jgi:hypothetical protein
MSWGSERRPTERSPDEDNDLSMTEAPIISQNLPQSRDSSQDQLSECVRHQNR